MFLEKSMFITPKGDHYTLNIFTVPTKIDKNFFEKQQLLLDSAKAVSAPYFVLAEEYITKRCRTQGVEVPQLKPRVLYEISNPNEAEFHVRMPMPFSELTRTENKVKDMFIGELMKKGWI